MTDIPTPWTGDACSLVDAFRSGERSPVEELEASIAAIQRSTLNAFSHLDLEAARQRALSADLTMPFGGVPAAVKELEPVAGWPHTEASLVFKGRIATQSSHHVERLIARGGANPLGATTASEFGGLNVSVTRINGVTHNPWREGRTVGGSSSGSAAAVSGGLVPLATGGDGGGSIRIPAGYCGLLGMKGTFGRITRAPHAFMRPNTVVFGNLSRSVRDSARYFDVCAGVDSYDPSTLESAGDWERSLGINRLAGLRVAVLPSIAGVKLEPGVAAHIEEQADALIAATGMVRVPLRLELPNLAAQWMVGNMATLVADLGDRWPKCAGELTEEIEIGMRLSHALYNLDTAAVAEELRVAANEAMARAFDEVDLIICATNPGPAFAADASVSSSEPSFIDWAKDSAVGRYGTRAALFGLRAVSTAAPRLPSKLLGQMAERFPDLVTMGGLTMISNVYGNPAVSIPAGAIDGLPIGMQVLGAHHRDGLLFDVALAFERERPWPLVAPAAD
jgi:aspartyl-tRNA(Asn)/glutamyl-tRNA(Gln) amidotransferase subunit A